MKMTEKLAIWTVYENPSDYPGKFIARKIIVGADPHSNTTMVDGDSLSEVREKIPGVLFRMERHPDDDPVIVETWM